MKVGFSGKKYTSSVWKSGFWISFRKNLSLIKATPGDEKHETLIDKIYWFFMKIILSAHNHTVNGVHTLFWLLLPYINYAGGKKGLQFPDIWQTVHTKLRKVQCPVYSKADPAETSPLLWSVADSVTTKQVRQNSFVLQAYFDIGLFGGLWMSGSQLWKHYVGPQGDFK